MKTLLFVRKENRLLAIICSIMIVSAIFNYGFVYAQTQSQSPNNDIMNLEPEEQSYNVDNDVPLELPIPFP